MMTRRLLAILMLAISATSSATGTVAGLAKFVDELPIPRRVRVPGWPFSRLTVTIGAFQTKLHRDLPPTTVWGYDGSSPGPTIEVERGQHVRVRWQNELPKVHLFPAPMGADVITPDVRSVTHLHGAVVTESEPLNRARNNDGWPDAWDVPGQSQIAEYPNDQTARTLWYHDHAMGETGRNVAAGLVGLYIIHDEYERRLGLPTGAFDIPLEIQARQVKDDGSLGYTNDITAEFYGNTVAVNGKLWPNLTVEPRKYRFRIVNVSNARSYALKLLDQKDRSAGPVLTQIGSDGGFLEVPALLNDPSVPASPRLTLAPAERADVIVDFSGVAGHKFLLHNNSHDPSDGEISLPEVMQFTVKDAVSQPDTSLSPVHMRKIVRLDPDHAAMTRQIVFNQMAMPDGGQMPILNGRHWSDPIEERPVLGTTEVWELVNTLIDTHPFHIHLVQFQVLDRRLFDVTAYLKNGKITYTGDPVAPAANEMGWKDTVRVKPQMVTRIIMRFTPYAGFYVYHCHILEHEDMDMMRPFEVVRDDTQISF